MTYQQPQARVADLIEIMVPPLGAFRVDAIVQDPRGRRYMKVSRRTGGSTEFRYVSASVGYRILTPQPIDEPSTRKDEAPRADSDERWAAINAGNQKALRAQIEGD